MDTFFYLKWFPFNNITIVGKLDLSIQGLFSKNFRNYTVNLKLEKQSTLSELMAQLV